MKIWKIRLLILILITIITACKKDNKNVNKVVNLEVLPFHMKVLTEESTGIAFVNEIHENNGLNYYSYEYLYNGGGVSVADFDNDGLEDIFFTRNMGKDKIYKNLGGLKFEDLTTHSQIKSINDWCTGSTIVDINGDGLLDIYVSRSGWFKDPTVTSNLLYVNQGNFQFKEESKKYGINDTGHTTQSTFFDADGDGDLDLYVMNHPIEFSEEIKTFKAHTKSPPKRMSDQLYINDNGEYKNESLQWGINNYGHGLGVIAADFNQDGKQDLYVSNDYQQHDFLYINTGDKFVDKSQELLRHMAKFSMGVDVADFDNDGDLDVYTVEMMPDDNYRKKTNMADMNPKLYETFINYGFQDQEMHNAFQINQNGNGFSEQAYLNGIAETDWSWAPLFIDLNGDLQKDLFISNGYRRDILNKDLKKKIVAKKIGTEFKYDQIKDLLTSTQSKNRFFLNDANSFTDVTQDINDAAFNSNGAAFADLDNDGDIDIVCNNMESKSCIYENLSNPQFSTTINLVSKNDKFGLGTLLTAKIGDQLYTYNNTATRGFQSSSSPRIVISNVASESIQWLEVRWSDGTLERFQDFDSDYISLIQGKGQKTSTPHPINTKISTKNVNYTHHKNTNNDYEIQPLLPYEISNTGPIAICADLNNDGNESIIIAGEKGQSTKLFDIDNNSLKKAKVTINKIDKEADYEDTGLCTLDLNGDGLLDIYITRGSYSCSGIENQTDKIYINQGESFKIINSPITSPSAAPIAIDYDNDGDQDVFVGGGYKYGQYPNGENSYILKNNNGKLEPIEMQTSIRSAITKATTVDVDLDGRDELLLVGEWSAPTILKYEDNGWKDISDQIIDSHENLKGMWSAISKIDIDNDGNPEWLLGNLGLNTKYQVNKNNPLYCYSTDVNKDNSYEVVLSMFEGNNEFPIRGMQCSSEQLPEIKEAISSYDIFAKSDVHTIYGNRLQDKYRFETNELRSGYLKRNENGIYIYHPFPKNMQASRIYSFAKLNKSNSNCVDILYHGNLKMEVETGILDGFGIESWNSCSNETTVYSSSASSKSQFIRSIIPYDNKFYFFRQSDSAILVDFTK